MPFTPEQIDNLLQSDESEIIERKSGFDNRKIRQALIAFANDQADRGRGWLILGQDKNKSIVGLKGDRDKIQRDIADIASTQCHPAIPVSIEVIDREGKMVSIVEIRRSVARPHFEGDAWVRIGSTTRREKDAEIMLMRAAQTDRKVALVTKWFNAGKRNVKFWTLPAPGSPSNRSPEAHTAELEDVTEDWIVLNEGGKKRSFPFIEFNVGYDPEKDRLVIRYHGATK